MPALWGEAASFVQGYEWNAPVVPSDSDRFTSGYRLIQTALMGGRYYCCTAVYSVS